MEEQWKQIQDFPNYNISSFGNVKNNLTDKLLKPCLKSGYYHISLVNNKIRKIFKIHRLVALAFLDNPDNKPEVNHKDKNKLNNNLNNLEWMTKKENNQHKSVGLVYSSNKNKPVLRLNKNTGEILQTYNSIEDAGLWAVENRLTKNSHNGRNSIGNCINGISSTSYGFKWYYKPVNQLTNEEWREIDLKHFFKEDILEKKYFVSNLGRYKNSFGTIMDNYKINENGYIRVYIYKKTFFLHRLIALTFLDNPENKDQVNHKDGNKLNNCVSNLEWVTNKENQIHKFQNGLGNNNTRKIKQFDLTGNYLTEYQSIALAAKSVNISKSSILGVLRNKRKTAAGFIWKYLD
jgi:hypothetical protein